MRRTPIATMVALVILAALVAGCFRPPAPGTGKQTSVAPTPGRGTPMPLASITPEMRPVTDFASLVDHLRSSGADVEQAGDTQNAIFTGKGRVLQVNGAAVQTFEYVDASTADTDASSISSDGAKVGAASVDWVAAPHFYKRDRLLVVYTGNDLQVINPLEFVLGRQFAGAPVGTLVAPAAPITPAPVQPTAAPRTPPAVASTAAPTANCTDRAQMSQDVTIPDNTVLAPDQTFVKTWRLKNTGTCTWSTAYQLAFVKGSSMGAPANVPLPSSVAPGSSVDVPVNMTAPASAGTYRGNWQFRNPAGKLFPISNSNDGTFWVQIIVKGSAATSQPSATGTPPEAQPITFPAGSTAATLNVKPPTGGTSTYLLKAQAGQELHIAAGAPGLVLVVTAPDGSRIAPSSVDSVGRSLFPLAAAGDYGLAFTGTPTSVSLEVLAK